MAAQQKQIDSLVDRVAVLLSSMHSEACSAMRCDSLCSLTHYSRDHANRPLVRLFDCNLSDSLPVPLVPQAALHALVWTFRCQVLQDVQASFSAFNFDARLMEMRRVGEELDARLNEFRVQVRRFGISDAASVQDQLVRLGESMSGLDVRFSGHEQKVHELEDQVGESMIAVHDRLTSQWDGASAEFKKLSDRLESAESDIALLSDEDPAHSFTDTIRKASDSLRAECQDFVLQQLEPATARLTALEDVLQEHFSQQHQDLLQALRSASEVAEEQERERAKQKDWLRQTRDDMRCGSFVNAVNLTASADY